MTALINLGTTVRYTKNIQAKNYYTNAKYSLLDISNLNMQFNSNSYNTTQS